MGLHGWGWAHSQGWGSTAEPVALPAVPGMQIVGAGDEGPWALLVCWPCSSPLVPTALLVLLHSPRAVCCGVLGGANPLLLPWEMWLWFTAEL